MSVSFNKNGNIIVPNKEFPKDVYNEVYLNGSLNYYASAFTATNCVNYTNFYMNATKPTSNTWSFIYLPNFNFDVGSNYMYRLWIKVNSGTNLRMSFRAARLENDCYGCNSAWPVSPELADGKWREYYLIQNIPENFVYNNVTKICNPRLEMLTDNRADSSMPDNQVINIDIMNVGVYKTDTYFPISDLYEDKVNGMARIGKDFLSCTDFIEY